MASAVRHGQEVFAPAVLKTGDDLLVGQVPEGHGAGGQCDSEHARDQAQAGDPAAERRRASHRVAKTAVLPLRSKLNT